VGVASAAFQDVPGATATKRCEAGAREGVERLLHMNIGPPSAPTMSDAATAVLAYSNLGLNCFPRPLIPLRIPV
jgi:hypothetical protein